jgi:hypothetical protein
MALANVCYHPSATSIVNASREVNLLGQPRTFEDTIQQYGASINTYKMLFELDSRAIV